MNTGVLSKLVPSGEMGPRSGVARGSQYYVSRCIQMQRAGLHHHYVFLKAKLQARSLNTAVRRDRRNQDLG